MSGISSGVGLATGLNINEIVDAIIGVQKNALVKLSSRAQAFEATEGGIKTLEANLLTLKTATQKLNLKSTFETLKATSSDTQQFSVAANSAQDDHGRGPTNETCAPFHRARDASRAARRV